MTDEKLQYARAQAYEFLQSQVLMVLSTHSADYTIESAAVFFYVDDDFSLYFMTPRLSRKATNLRANPDVAAVVTSLTPPITVQAQGKALEISDPQAQEKILARLYRIAKHASQGKLLPIEQMSVESYCVYKITPTRMRIADYRDRDGDGLVDLFTQVME